MQGISWDLFELQNEKQLNNSPARIQELSNYIAIQIEALSFSEHRKTAHDCLQALTSAQTPEAIHTASMRWQTEYNNHFCVNNGQIYSHFEQTRALSTVLQQRLMESSNLYLHTFAQSKAAIQSLIQQTTLQTQQLHYWSEGKAGPNLWNIMPFDMGWVTETIKSLAFTSAQDKMQMLLDTLHQKHNLIGFINQVGIHPWLRVCR